jgi:hypothetical protein
VSDETLLILSQKGVVHSIDTRRLGAPAEELFFALDEEDFAMNAVSAGFAVSSSRALISTGTSVGTISQFSISAGPFLVDPEDKKCINENSTHIDVIKPFPSPELSYGMNHSSLATAYVLSNSVPSKSLLSSFRSTPAGMS